MRSKGQNMPDWVIGNPVKKILKTDIKSRKHLYSHRLPSSLLKGISNNILKTKIPPIISTQYENVVTLLFQLLHEFPRRSKKIKK